MQHTRKVFIFAHTFRFAIIATMTKSKKGNWFRRNWWWLGGLVLAPLVLFVAVAVSFTLGYTLGSHKFNALVSGNISNVFETETPRAISEAEEIDFEPFWDAWTLLNQRFYGSATFASTTVGQVSGQEKVWGAISGLTASYGDPFTTFLPPEDNEIFEADIQGEFSGVGMEIGSRNGLLTVISPLPGTPAAQAGIRPKDVVAEIDGVDSLNMPTDQAVRLIRGPKGEPVVLSILREGQTGPLEITVIRDVIDIPTITTELSGDVFIISLYSFTAKSPELFKNALQEFIDSGSERLILDLRGNPGGFLQAAVSVSSWFLAADKLIVEEDFGGNQENKPHYSQGFNVFTDRLKMVILTNGGSASASEIVAGALRDHRVALLVGQTTFGKGSVQELFDLTDETSLKITIAKWLTPSGDHISEDGIVPDIPVGDNYSRDEFASSFDIDDQDPMIAVAKKALQDPDFKNFFDEVPAEYLATSSATSTASTTAE